MLSAIVLAIAGGAGICLALINRTKLRRRSGWITALAMLAAITGPILAVKAGREIANAREIKGWPTVTGVILKSDIVGDRAIRPLVHYQYRVSDSIHTDSSTLGVPPFGNRRVRLNESETIVAEYKPGDSVKVYYDPLMTGRSTLYAREDWASYIRLAMGALLFGVGLYVLVGFGLSVGALRQR